jgi:hypothetical protein
MRGDILETFWRHSGDILETFCVKEFRRLVGQRLGPLQEQLGRTLLIHLICAYTPVPSRFPVLRDSVPDWLGLSR